MRHRLQKFAPGLLLVPHDGHTSARIRPEYGIGAVDPGRIVCPRRFIKANTAMTRAATATAARAIVVTSDVVIMEVVVVDV